MALVALGKVAAQLGLVLGGVKASVVGLVGLHVALGKDVAVLGSNALGCAIDSGAVCCVDLRIHF